MTANLRQKDLLVVGFWSDWDYLNQLIGGAVQGLAPLSVTVVDLSSARDLEHKAPDLWALAHQPHVTFTHVQESGADALDELRRAFSEGYLRQILAAGRAVFENATGVACDPAWLQECGFDSEGLYNWRRDAEGVPATHPATSKRPSNSEALGYFHLLLRRAGAVSEPQGYRLAGQQIRVVNGAGSFLSSVEARFVEPPAAPSADIFVAAGATDLGLPAHVVRTGVAGSVVRPAARGRWLTLEKAQVELGI